MIDDLPSFLTNVESSLFADDTAVYKSGRSIDHLNTTMQNNLANIQKWCDQWGFRLSLDKTVAILFSHAIKDHKINLNLGPKQIKIVDSVKFLGVILDKKLNWNEHIQYVQSKCKKRINLMKAITGSTWGASTKALLTVYKALIRSVIDYGDIAYDSAANNHLNKLDKIQNHALKICAGAMKSTATDALQVELDEPPLNLRRLKHQIEFGIKANVTLNHPALSAATDHWTVHYGHYNKNNQPLFQKIAPFLDAHDLTTVEKRNHTALETKTNKY